MCIQRAIRISVTMVSRLMLNIQNPVLFSPDNTPHTDVDLSTFIAYGREGSDDLQSLPVYFTSTEADHAGLQSSDSPSPEPVWHR